MEAKIEDLQSESAGVKELKTLNEAGTHAVFRAFIARMNFIEYTYCEPIRCSQ